MTVKVLAVVGLAVCLGMGSWGAYYILTFDGPDLRSGAGALMWAAVWGTGLEPMFRRLGAPPTPTCAPETVEATK